VTFLNISLYGSFFLEPIINSLEKDDNNVYFNKFSKDVDVVIVQSISYMYEIMRLLNIIRKLNIKLINIVPDIPPWRLEGNYNYNTFKYYVSQSLFFLTNRNQIIFDSKKKIENFFEYKFSKGPTKIYSKIFGRNIKNKFEYRIYRNFLKESDLILSFSKFTKNLVKEVLNLESHVWYPCANSEFLNTLPKNPEIKFDAINISRIVKNKKQHLFVRAANKLGLNIIIIGPHQDKSIKLDCTHFPLPHEEALEYLNQSQFYVDTSTFEGFGMTPVEAAFLNKPTIASDIYVHKEVLGNYPLYFKSGDINDLCNKIKILINNDYEIDKNSLRLIKKKYSIENCKNKLKEYIEWVF